MSINKVIISGDFLRPNNEGNSSQNININWLYHAAGGALSQATGLPVERRLYGTSLESTTQKIYRWNGLDVSINSWASLYFNEPNLRAVGEIWAQFRDAFVVGFEMPYFMKKALALAGIGFVDIVIHPVRFMDDLIFGLQAANPQVLQDAFEYAVYEDDVYSQAGLVQASMSRLPRKSGVMCGAALFAGQTDDDKTLIKNGKFINPFEERELIEGALASYPQILLKPHPYGKRHKSTLLLSRTMANTEIVESNFYYLISHDEVEDVVSFCSSTSIEAAYFGKNGRMIFDYPYRFAFAKDDIDEFVRNDVALSSYVTSFAPFYTADFWRKSLRSVLPVTPTNGRTLPTKPNRFRVSLRNFWGFDFVDRVV